MTVGDLLQRNLSRLRTAPPTLPFIAAVQAVQDVIMWRLWEKKSDLLMATWASARQTIPEGGGDIPATVTLPSDFLGIAELPYIEWEEDGETQVRTLNPISRHRSQYVTLDPAVPSEYEIRGTSIQVFQTPSVEYILNLGYFARPAVLAALTDSLPWNGAYDQLFTDAVLQMAGIGGMLAVVTPTLSNAIALAVDTQAPLRTGRSVRWLCA